MTLTPHQCAILHALVSATLSRGGNFESVEIETGTGSVVTATFEVLQVLLRTLSAPQGETE